MRDWLKIKKDKKMWGKTKKAIRIKPQSCFFSGRGS